MSFRQSLFRGRYLRNTPFPRYTLEVRLNLVLFKEDDVFFVHAPELNLTGYGKTNEEANESFNYVVESYIEYGLNKKTLLQDLRNHGWEVKINDTRRKLFVATQAPSLERQLSDQDKLREVLANPQTTFATKPVKIPLGA